MFYMVNYVYWCDSKLGLAPSSHNPPPLPHTYSAHYPRNSRYNSAEIVWENHVCLIRMTQDSDIWTFYASVTLNLVDASLTNFIIYATFSRAFGSTLKAVVKKLFLRGHKFITPQSSTRTERLS